MNVSSVIRNDEELSKLLSQVIISEGGVIPNIHPNLLPTKSKKGKHDDASVSIPTHPSHC
jgi:histone H2A